MITGPVPASPHDTPKTRRSHQSARALRPRRHRRLVDRGLSSLAGLSGMKKAPKALSPQVQAWVEARKRYRLSHAQVQMARELGLNPRKLGKIANYRQEPWKTPLPQFIRTPLSQEIRPGPAPGRCSGGGLDPADGRREGRAQRCGREPAVNDSAHARRRRDG